MRMSWLLAVLRQPFAVLAWQDLLQHARCLQFIMTLLKLHRVHGTKAEMVLLWVKELVLLCLRNLSMQNLGVLKFMAKLKAMECQAMHIILQRQPKMVMARSARCKRL